MRIVVTGASGFLGRHLVPALAAQGHEGLAVSRSPAGLDAPASWQWASRDELLRTNEAVADCLVHLEVKQHVLRPSARALQDFETVNIVGTEAWLNWCARAQVRRVVYLSSIKAVRPAPEGATDEGAEGPPPASPYGASKWAAEKRVAAWVERNASNVALILRPAVVYGAGGQGNITAMAAAIRRRRFFLIGRNENVKSMVALENLTAATTFLLDRMEPGRAEAYNIVDAESLTVREIDAVLRQELGRSGNSPALPAGLARLAGVVGDLALQAGWRGCPISSSRVEALQEETHFSARKLMAAGFVHPCSVREGLRKLARATATPSSPPSHG